jgi:transposase
MLIPIIRRAIEPDSIVYTDGFLSYDTLDVSKFRHHLINHSEKFVQARNHINRIQSFGNRSKRHLSRFNGVPREHFNLFIEECEWRFNFRLTVKLFETLFG